MCYYLPLPSNPLLICVDEMEGKEQLEELKIRQRRELQIQKQNHMLMRMAGRHRQQLNDDETNNPFTITLSNTQITSIDLLSYLPVILPR